MSVVVDFPDRVVEAMESRVKKWGASFDELLEIGERNLWKRSRERFERPHAGVWVSPWKDNHDSSRLCLTQLIARLEVNGDHVATIPNRDTLVVTGSDDEHGLEAMATMGDRLVEQPRPQSFQPVVLHGNAWSPFNLPSGHPLIERFKMLEVKQLIANYGQQGEVLEKRLEKEGRDVFVASFKATKDTKSGLVRSFAVWSEGVHSFLPEADILCFYRDQKPDSEKMFRVPFESARLIVETMMEPMGLFPERYEVRAFPSEAQLETLRQMGVD